MKAMQLAVILVAFSLGGCKVQITVPATGAVVSGSGSYDCGAGKVCEIDVLDLFFDEIFSAQPSSGYVFKQWKVAGKHFCGGTKEPCALSTDGLDQYPVLMSFLESDEVFYLEPVFIAEEDAPKIMLTGTWSYVQKLGDCTARGQIYQEVVPGEGVYQTLTLESAQVSATNPCEYVVAGDFPSQTVGPISTVQYEPISESEMESRYAEVFGLYQIIQFKSGDEYKITTPGGDNASFTYTRVGN